MIKPSKRLTTSSLHLIDGGLSNVLEAKGYDLNHKLWTASLLKNNPKALIEAHTAYIEAGAECIASASYQASIPGLVSAGYTEQEAEGLLLKSVHLVEVAIQQALDNMSISLRPIIAASMGPYGAFLADGSEYRGNYEVTEETLCAFHTSRIEIFSKSSADVLAFETIPSFHEARVISALLQSIDKQAWISFSCADGQHLNDGTTITDAMGLFQDHPTVFAVGVNCTHPKYISSLIKSIKAGVRDKKIIVYPNSGEAYHAATKSWKGTADSDLFVEMASEWHQLGADILGGCCRIGPDHIRKIKNISRTSY